MVGVDFSVTRSRLDIFGVYCRIEVNVPPICASLRSFFGNIFDFAISLKGFRKMARKHSCMWTGIRV